jgi:hypothetical protein
VFGAVLRHSGCDVASEGGAVPLTGKLRVLPSFVKNLVSGLQLVEPSFRCRNDPSESSPVHLGLGTDRPDDEHLSDLPVERPPRAAPSSRAQFAEAHRGPDGTGVRVAEGRSKGLQFLDGVGDRNLRLYLVGDTGIEPVTSPV